MADFYVVKNEVVAGEFTDYSEARAFAVSLGNDALLVADTVYVIGSLYTGGVKHCFTVNSQIVGTGSNNVFIFGGYSEGETSGDTGLYFSGTRPYNTWVFGGNAAGTHTGNAEIVVENASFNGTRSAIYGGGNAAAFVGDISISINASGVGNVYAGGRTGAVTGAVTIEIENSAVNGSLYGAGWNADLRGDLTLDMMNSQIVGDLVIGGERGGVVYGRSTVLMDDVVIGGDLQGSGNTELLISGYTLIEGTAAGIGTVQLDAVADPGACLSVVGGAAIDNVIIRLDSDARNGNYVFATGIDSNLLNVTLVVDSETFFVDGLYRGDNPSFVISDTVAWSLTYSESKLVMSVVDSGMAKTPFHLEEIAASGTTLSTFYDTLGDAAAAANDSRMALVRLLCNGDAEGDFVLNANEAIFNNAVITGSVQIADEDSFRSGDAAIQLNSSSVTGDVIGGGFGGDATLALVGGTIGGGIYGGGTQGVDGVVQIVVTDGSVGAALTDAGGAVATIAAGGLTADADVNGNVMLYVVNGTLRGGIYGGGVADGADVNGNVTIYIEDGFFGGVETAEDSITYYQSNIYGGGKGVNLVTGNVEMMIANGVILGSVYGAGEAGRVEGDVNFSMAGGQIRYNLYGAGVTGHAGVGGDVVITIYDGILGGVNLDENGNEVFDSGNIYGGSRTRSWVDGDVIINIHGGSIFGSIYGGSHFGTDNIAVHGGTIRGGLYGSCDGGKGVTITVNGGQIGEGIADAGGAVAVICGTGLTYGNLNGDVNIALNGGTIRGGVYAGGTVDGVGIKGNTTITVGECFVGGMAEAEGGPVYYWSNIYGGGKGANIVSGDSTISVAGGTVLGSIFGGGEAGRVEGDVAISVASGWVRGDIFGGGDTGFAGVGGNVSIVISGGTIGGLAEINGVGTYNCGNIYGSGRGRNYIDEDVNISIESGIIYGSVYGGSRFGANNIAIAGGEIYGSVFGSLKGAGTDTVITVTDAVIGLANQDAAAGVLYGGAEGDDAVAMGSAAVVIAGGTLNGSVYGGGKGTGTVGSAAVTVEDGLICGNVYGGGENGTVAGDVVITVNGGTIGGAICGSAGAVAGAVSIILNGVTVNSVCGDTADVVAGETSLTISGDVTVTGSAADLDMVNLAVGDYLTAGQLSSAAYNIAMDNAEGNGLYQLASGVVIGDAVTVSVEIGGQQLGQVTLAADLLTDSFVYDGNTYTVSAAGGLLSVKIEDGITPADYDVNGDVFADLVLVHEAGYTGAWTIQGDLIPVWLDLSNLSGDFSVLGVGCINADDPANDIILYSKENNMIGAWTTGADGAVTGWETIAAFDDVVEVLGVADFNGDNLCDMLLSINGEYGTFLTGGAAWNLLGAADGYAAVCTGDLNGDGTSDLLLGGETGAKIWFVDAAQDITEAAVTGLTGTVCGAGDFDGDGVEELLVSDGGMLKIAAFDEAFNAVYTETGIAAADCSVEQIADFNADGLADIALRTASGDVGAMVMANGVYEWHYFGSVGSEWTTSVSGL